MASSASPRAASSRRNFFFGRTRAVEPALRPPWALEEDDFVARCTRCDRCIEACPTSILVRMDGGFPGVDFGRGECTFCGDCVAACEPRALQRDATTAPWDRVAVIGEACLAARGVECRVCGESCPEGAIRFRPRLGGVAHPQLDAAACTACGACIGPCPTRAIDTRARESLPTESET